MGAMGIFAAILVLLIPSAILGLWIASLEDVKYRNVLYKLHVLRMGFGHMLFSTDKKFPKKTPTPKSVIPTKTKTIIFVRHAESAWNLVFNKGFGSDFPGRLSSALKLEAELFPTLDSVFVDSPLSAFGTSQALTLQEYVKKDLIDELKDRKSIIVSSNLRRALSTGTIGFWERLRQTKEKIKILSCLQEVTFNMDGMSLAKPFTAPQLSKDELNALGYKSLSELKSFSPKQFYDCSENTGNKIIRSSGFDRMFDFCSWCFAQEQEEYDTVVAVGHSLYFRYFFRLFLDADEKHEAKMLKMANCSVVQFDLQQGRTDENKEWFRIPPESMQVLAVGFEKDKESKKKE